MTQDLGLDPTPEPDVYVPWPAARPVDRGWVERWSLRMDESMDASAEPEPLEADASS